MTINIDEIKKIIPHRYPFLMIDKIIEIENGISAKAIKCVSSNEPYFQGHFPDYFVMPGVLQIEAVAQVGAVALLNENRGQIAFLGGVKNARFYREIKPGDILEISCKVKKRIKNIGFGEGSIFCGDEKVMSCEISFALS
ncbi:3-hydroxyacyl-[acyl-carrier-protein] dehydratase [Peptoniphilus olsenii]|uniref:3-hydroxyacyl-[acyl-carrier-protein] dehydratase n=1 Tax=Peptoniphilus olsenii TaxID=411570 RepID=A0ABV2JAU4_9FIRM